ncbi:MAG: FAD-binding protein [Deltaproteobacteria bacterium]|nr:MAG: FAD-binding protein [Deltaproteobacteria bacterium]
MALKNLSTVPCDVLVIGGGGTGLRAAIEAKENGADVLIVSKSRVGYANNTYISKGTFAAATGWGDSRDNPEVHIKDSIDGGRFINDKRLLAAVARHAAAQIPFLEKCGVKFFRQHDAIAVTHTPGHSYPRHVRGERQEGSDLIIPIRNYAERIGVHFAERIFITRLFIKGDRVVAATGIAQDGSFMSFVAKSIILAMGGFAQVYLHTNNAPGITGDGQALAFELGVPLKDMEFVQFYPTALGNVGNRILLYEGFVFGAGGVLRNAQGDDIISKQGLSDPMAMTRDRLTRAIMLEILEGRDIAGGVLMDLSAISEKKLAPLMHLLPAARSPDERKYVVSPTAHFCMGGIIVNEHAETAVPGLFAAGEVCAGVHGANRLGGNALAEVFAMGEIAGKNAACQAQGMELPTAPAIEMTKEKNWVESLYGKGDRDPGELRRELKQVLWSKAGIIRTENELEEALRKVQELSSYLSRVHIGDTRGLLRYLELRNMLFIGDAVCRAALMRTETRGSHYRSDYPEEDNENWLKNILVQKQGSGMRLETASVDRVP